MTQDVQKLISEFKFMAANSANEQVQAMCNKAWQMLTDFLQQPIPQDINLEDEAAKTFPARELDTWKSKREGFIAGAQLLLPQLQECKDKLWAFESITKHQEKELQECKEQLAQAKEMAICGHCGDVIEHPLCRSCEIALTLPDEEY